MIIEKDKWELHKEVSDYFQQVLEVISKQLTTVRILTSDLKKNKKHLNNTMTIWWSKIFQQQRSSVDSYT